MFYVYSSQSSNSSCVRTKYENGVPQGTVLSPGLWEI